MKTTATKISETKLRAMRVIRSAWFDESLDAEARGDTDAAAQAKLNLTVCDVQIRRIENEQKPRADSYQQAFRSAFQALRARA